MRTLEFLSERGLSGSVTYITCRMYPACTCGTVSPLTCSNLATLILMELLRHAEFDVSRRAILMVSSVTDIMNLVRSQDIMRDYFIVTWSHHTNGINISSSLRLRGGMNTGTNPNIRKDLFDIPSLTKARFKPCPLVHQNPAQGPRQTLSERV